MSGNLYNSNPGIYGSFGGFPPMYGSIPGAPVSMPGKARIFEEECSSLCSEGVIGAGPSSDGVSRVYVSLSLQSSRPTQPLLP